MEKKNLPSHQDGEKHFKTILVLNSQVKLGGVTTVVVGCYVQVIAGLKNIFHFQLISFHK